MSWEWVVPFMNIATLIFIAGGTILVMRQKTFDLAVSLEGMKKDLSDNIAEVKEDVSDRMGKIEENLDKLTVVMVQQARHDERMNAMDQRQLGQTQRLDEFMRSQGAAHDRIARMVESTISRVNDLADRGIRPARSS